MEQTSEMSQMQVLFVYNEESTLYIACHNDAPVHP